MKMAISNICVGKTVPSGCVFMSETQIETPLAGRLKTLAVGEDDGATESEVLAAVDWPD